MKKLIAILLILTVSVSLVGCDLFGGATTTQATTAETVTVDTTNYIDVSTVAELQAIEMNKSYRLTADLNLDGIEWVPLGTYTDPYLGNFDGNGHTLSNLTITNKNTYTLGLFGYTRGVISDLTLSDVVIDVQSDFLIYVGALVGFTDGDLIGNTVTNAAISIVNTTSNTYAGLLAGFAKGKDTTYLDEFVPNLIQGNHVDGSVYVNSAEIAFQGGLVGKTYNSTIAENYVESTITLAANGTDVPVYVGGLVGHNYGGILVDHGVGIIEDTDIFTNNNIVYATIHVTSNHSNLFVGGFMGFNQSSVLLDNYTYVDITLEGSKAETNTVYVGGFVGENFEALSESNAVDVYFSALDFTNSVDAFIDAYVAGRFSTILAVDVFVVNTDGIAVAQTEDDVTVKTRAELSLDSDLGWSQDFIDDVLWWLSIYE
ncbi:MAG: hypothetical protein JXB08_05470 [Bacilli bacterium]|nr:hypothetical protein [Bacilli bacterium]MBN2877047.1 hypothetical protein [Bacilli bacterium]